MSSSPLPAFQFVDLFAGIGGTRLGFETAGGSCVFSAEWDRFARTTYEENFYQGYGHIFASDITKVDARTIPEHDVLLAGFPCQPFSLAGVSKKNSLGRAHGFLDETQGTLFFDIARILASKRPRAFMLENVKNLAGHDGGRTFDVIRDVLEVELGYRISYRIVDARSWVPQHRERLIIVGHDPDQTGCSGPFDFSTLDVPEVGPRLGSILHGNGEPPYTKIGSSRVDDRYTLSDKLWEYLKAYAEKHRRLGNGFGFSLFGPDDVARTLSARYHKDGSEILIEQGRKRNPRRLTPRECARLMGFTPHHFPSGRQWVIPVSDTQAYRQFGNSIVVPMVQAVASAMVEQFGLLRIEPAVPRKAG